MGCGYIVTGDTESSSDLKGGYEECSYLKSVIYQKSSGEKPVANIFEPITKQVSLILTNPWGETKPQASHY